MVKSSFDYIIFNEQKLKQNIFYIFIFFSFLVLNITLFVLRNNNKLLLKGKLFIFIFIDIIQKLLYNKKYNLIKSISQELLMSILTTSQFFLVISFIYEIFSIERLSHKNKYFGLISRFKLTIIFTLLIFPYHLFINRIENICEIVQTLIISFFLYELYYYLNIVVKEIIYNNKSKDIQMRLIYNYLKDLNKICILLFICYYILKIILILIENRIIIFYIDFLLIIIDNGLKYLIFFILTAIIYKLPKNFYNKFITNITDDKTFETK